MKITVLIDNRCSRADLVAEHGLSLFIETDAHRILVDTGLSGKAFDNAEKLGIDIQTVDYLVLSHGHIDHTGGLRRFVEVNHTARIVASCLVPRYQYFSNRGGKLHSLSPDEDVIRQNMETINDSNREKVLEDTKNEVLDLLKNTIRPEFLNHIDETVIFSPLTRDEIAEVVKIQMRGVNKALKEQGLEIILDDDVLDWIAELGYEPEFGARPVKRVIQKEILNKLATDIISGKVGKKPQIHAHMQRSEIVFE